MKSAPGFVSGLLPSNIQPSFLEDLESIVRVIAAKDAGAAGRLGELLVRTGESLAFFPERHPCVRQRRELRRCIVAQHYKVFYRVKASERAQWRYCVVGTAGALQIPPSNERLEVNVNRCRWDRGLCTLASWRFKVEESPRNTRMGAKLSKRRVGRGSCRPGRWPGARPTGGPTTADCLQIEVLNARHAG